MKEKLIDFARNAKEVKHADECLKINEIFNIEITLISKWKLGFWMHCNQPPHIKFEDFFFRVSAVSNWQIFIFIILGEYHKISKVGVSKERVDRHSGKLARGAQFHFVQLPSHFHGSCLLSTDRSHESSLKDSLYVSTYWAKWKSYQFKNPCKIIFVTLAGSIDQPGSCFMAAGWCALHVRDFVALASVAP